MTGEKMEKINILKSREMPGFGLLEAGKECQLPAHIARQLCDQGFAEIAEPVAKMPKVKESKPETETNLIKEGCR